MAKPQQPEIAPVTDDAGPLPAENTPGHHPPVEQDKPTRPPRPRARTPKPAAPKVPDPARFDFEFDPPLESIDRFLGIRPSNSYIEVAGQRVTVQFGPWKVETTKDNVAQAEITGPYTWWKVAGPPRLSFADRGLTMATTTRQGVCIKFHKPVRGIEPAGLLRHPGLTVTPENPDALVEALTRDA
jgi:hypothetical protein